MLKKFIWSFTLLLILVFFQCKPDTSKEKNPDHPYLSKIETTFTANKHGVVTAHYLATNVALNILNKGGNAVDAAIASQFALAVVYPRAGNIGGGGYMMIASDSSVKALDYREKAPSKAHRKMYLDENEKPSDTLSLTGHLASGVPGTVAGLYQAFKAHSKLNNWSELLEPAIGLAKNGFPITTHEAQRLNRYQAVFKKINPENKVFVRNNEWNSGDTLIQSDLGSTLQRIAEDGRDGFYQGRTADLIVNEMNSAYGIISHDDLKNYTAVWRKPVKVSYHGYDVYSMPPSSSGGIALGQMLEILNDYSIRNYPFHGHKATHLMIEAMRVVYEDRAKYLGDPDFYEVPRDSLLSDTYLRSRMQDFTMDSSRTSDVSTLKSVPLMKESYETTHTSIIDENGMAVSVTTTINSNYGSKLIIDDAGFFMNNEMNDFSLKPGVPNQFGLIGAEANAIQPHKRMLSSMTPTIVLNKEGDVSHIIGTPGGSTIITSILQNLIAMIDYDIPIDSSIAMPRFHHQWIPDTVIYEDGAFTLEVLDPLHALGHATKQVSSIALVKGISITDGKIHISGDPRSEDHAGGE